MQCLAGAAIRLRQAQPWSKICDGLSSVHLRTAPSVLQPEGFNGMHNLLVACSKQVAVGTVL